METRLGRALRGAMVMLHPDRVAEAWLRSGVSLLEAETARYRAGASAAAARDRGGIGKARLFGQLASPGVPCIDADFSFESWADPDKQCYRPSMAPDSRLDFSRVRLLSDAGKADLLAAIAARGGPAG